MGMKQWLTWGIKMEGADKAAKEVDKVSDATKNAEKSQEALNDTIEESAGALDNMTGGALSAFKGVVGGVKKAVIGMKTLKGAIAATGIGLLVLAVTSLVMYFTKTKKGAEVLQVATAALGAVFGVISDVLSSIGEAMVSAFQNPQEAIQAVSDKMEALGGWFSDLGNYLREVFLFSMLKIKRSFLSLAAASKEFLGFDASDMRAEIRSIDKELNASVERMEVASDKVTAPLKEAWDTVTEGVSNFIDTVATAVKSASALEKRAIKLADAQRALGVEFSESRLEIQKLKMASDDLNNTTEERIEAAEKAGAIEKALMEKRMALAQEELDIKRAQNALSESTAEDLQAEADLQSALADLQIESLGIQTELMMKVAGLRTEAIAKLKEEEAAEAELAAAAYARQLQIESIMSEEIERARLALEIKQMNELAMAVEHGKDLKALGELHDRESLALEKKFQDEKSKIAADALKGKMDLAVAGLGALQALNDAFAGESEKEQKKAFERNKAIGIVSAIINTAGAVMGALNPASGGLGIPAGIPGAAIATATGVAQIAVIAKSKFGGGSTTPAPAPNPPPPPAAAAAAASTAPEIDFGFLGGGATGGIQAYVVSNNVSNGLQAEQQLQDQTVL